MSSLGLQLFEQQRTTIDSIHGSNVVGPRFQRKTDSELLENPGEDQTHTIYYPPPVGREVWDDETGVIDLVKQLSTDLPSTNIAYARIVRMGEEMWPITVFRGGKEYYVVGVDPLIIYSLGGSRFYPQPSRTDEYVFNAGMMIEFYGFPVIMYPVDSGEYGINEDLECRLASNGYDNNFLSMIGGDNMGYNRVLRGGDGRFRELCPDGSVEMEPEYKILPRASEKMIPRIQELAKMLSSALSSDFCGTSSDNIDIMFRIFDVAVGLAARDIEFQIHPGNLFTTIARIHMAFIRNMPDSQGRFPFSYPRRPLSYYLDSSEDAIRKWNELAASFSPQKYQDFYDHVSNKPGNLEPDMPNLGKSTTLGTLVGRKDALLKIRQKASIVKLDGRVAEYFHPGWGEEDISYLYYNDYFRDSKMSNMPLKHWNLGIVSIGRKDMELVALSDLGSRGYDESDIVGRFVKHLDKVSYVEVRKKTLSDDSIPVGEGTNLEEPTNNTYVELEEEEPLMPITLKYSYVTINGVSFNSRDIALLYNTPLATTFLSQDDQHIELPRLDHRDLRVLQSLFSGRISLLYFYENASDYMYSLLSFERTMLDVFDLVFARQIILCGYRLGVPLREQLAELDYSKYGVGKVSRLDELISEARRVSDF